MLVVEDEPDLRAYLRALLAPTYEVLTAADGQEALELLSREAPVDLVATDAMMPRLSGTELIAKLKAEPARAGVPVLMLTARADDAHRRAALTVGVDDYLTKPFAPAELLARVQVLPCPTPPRTNRPPLLRPPGRLRQPPLPKPPTPK